MLAQLLLIKSAISCHHMLSNALYFFYVISKGSVPVIHNTPSYLKTPFPQKWSLFHCSAHIIWGALLMICLWLAALSIVSGVRSKRRSRRLGEQLRDELCRKGNTKECDKIYLSWSCQWETFLSGYSRDGISPLPPCHAISLHGCW